MMPIAEVAAGIRANPAPVLIADTCCFLDLFRVARPSKETAEERERRPEVSELEAARALLDALTGTARQFHLVVPELVPGEFADNAEVRVAEPFRKWADAHNASASWLSRAVAAAELGVTIPAAVPVSPDVPDRFRDFAERLLSTATVLARDLSCLLRAVDRVVGKKRPSHRKEVKDSMNLEQSLELSRQLSANEPFGHPVVFASSNTKDFAAPNGDIHADLVPEFDAVGLTYRTSFRAALPLLRITRQSRP